MPSHDPYYIARKTPDASVKDYERQIDMAALRRYRLNRVRAQLAACDHGACLLYNPMNIRYATGTRNMQVYSLHASERYAFVPAEGPVVLFDGYYCNNPLDASETVDERRPAISCYFETKGDRVEEAAKRMAAEIADLVKTHCGGNRRLGIDRLGIPGVRALEAEGLDLVDADVPMETARSIKSPEEVACMSVAVAACEAGMARMHEALRAGMTEIELWSLLVHGAHALGAEWMETRLLTSGGRTNPWYQECSDKVIRPGDLVAFDTDLVGPFGYCVDVSRTFHCGPGKPSDEQRRLYQAAYEHVQYNMALLKPGLSFREFAETCWEVPEEFVANRYGLTVHGVGLADEWPDIPHLIDWEETGYDGVFEENMILCIESYTGAEGGAEGVKLEEQILLTADGPQILSTFPFEEALLA
jgi:Xaa-Pro aminopeptidase